MIHNEPQQPRRGWIIVEKPATTATPSTSTDYTSFIVQPILGCRFPTIRCHCYNSRTPMEFPSIPYVRYWSIAPRILQPENGSGSAGL